MYKSLTFTKNKKLLRRINQDKFQTETVLHSRNHNGNFTEVLFVFTRQKKEAAQSYDEWYSTTLKLLGEASPLSLKVTLRSVSFFLSFFIFHFCFSFTLMLLTRDEYINSSILLFYPIVIVDP